MVSCSFRSFSFRDVLAGPLGCNALDMGSDIIHVLDVKDAETAYDDAFVRDRIHQSVKRELDKGFPGQESC